MLTFMQYAKRHKRCLPLPSMLTDIQFVLQIYIITCHVVSLHHSFEKSYLQPDI
jgi:hypothetical protein